MAASVLLSSYIFYQTTGLYILSTFVSLIIAHEVLKLTIKPQPVISLFFLILKLGWFTFFFFSPRLELMGLAIIMDLCLWLWSKRFEKESSPINSSMVFAYIFYALMAPTFVVAHLKAPQGALALFSLLLIVFSFDTFSYFSGKSLGNKLFKVKLFPKASPSKTIEGAIFGALFSTGFMMAINHYTILKTVQLKDFTENFASQFLILLLFCFISLSGDLFESLLKRESKVKDSGQLMPGHGGLFDRLDGVLFAGILSYILLIY